MKVLVTEPTQDDIREIGEYIRQDSPPAAARLVEGLLAACRELARNPNRYPKASTLGLRKRAHGAYLIFYRVGPVIEVVRILHAARDWTHLLDTDED